MCSLSRVVPATDSWVTLAIRSYTVDGCDGPISRSNERGKVHEQFMSDAKFHSLTFTEIESSKRKVDNSWILFLDECIYSKSLKV